MTNDIKGVIQSIERAFAGVQLEDGVSIREANVMDHHGNEEECRAARAEDEQGDWRRVPDALVESHSSSLSYFDAKGMRFYLPAYMRFVLRHFESSQSPSICCTLFALGEDDQRFELLNAEQREAVRQFLEVMATQDVLKDEKNDAKEALDTVWSKPLERAS